jgi:hypothetical protein
MYDPVGGGQDGPEEVRLAGAGGPGHERESGSGTVELSAESLEIVASDQDVL